MKVSDLTEILWSFDDDVEVVIDDSDFHSEGDYVALRGLLQEEGES